MKEVVPEPCRSNRVIMHKTGLANTINVYMDEDFLICSVFSRISQISIFSVKNTTLLVISILLVAVSTFSCRSLLKL